MEDKMLDGQSKARVSMVIKKYIRLKELESKGNSIIAIKVKEYQNTWLLII